MKLRSALPRCRHMARCACAGADDAAACISVTGEATESAPDQAQIDGGVTSDAKTAREASEANNTAMTKVLLALKGAGIDEKDSQTSRLRCNRNLRRLINPRSSHRDRQLPRQQPRHGQLRDVTKVANVIDILVGAGANDIGGINFTVSQASNFWTKPARRRLRMPAARPRSLPRPPA